MVHLLPGTIPVKEASITVVELCRARRHTAPLNWTYSVLMVAFGITYGRP